MKYDLYCLGSALVDMTFQIDDDFTKRNEERGISKGAMTLIEKDDQNSLISELKDLISSRTSVLLKLGGCTTGIPFSRAYSLIGSSGLFSLSGAQ